MHEFYDERPVFDFSPMGSAIKKARMEQRLSRESLAEICDVSPGYIKTIETGKNPGFPLFWRLVTFFNISVDEYFYPENKVDTDSQLRNVMGMLREIEADDIYVVESTLNAMKKRKAADKDEE